MISATTEYALRAIVLLAEAGPGATRTVEEIANGTSVPIRYLAKVMQVLARADLVSSQRGLHGGFVLLRQPAELTVYDVVQAVDPILRITACPRTGLAPKPSLCSLHRGLDQAMAGLEAVFRTLTIEGFLQRGGGRPACSIPHPHASLPVARPSWT